MKEEVVLTFEKQTKLFDAESGTRGNCMAACYANYLGLPISKIPAFEELFDCSKPEGFWWDVVMLWWKRMGYEYHVVHMPEDIPKEVEMYFVGGISPRNPKVCHLVIYKNGELFFDPHPDNTGIVFRSELSYEYVIKKN